MTVIKGLQLTDETLESLCTTLKNTLGAGGAVKDLMIEIQVSRSDFRRVNLVAQTRRVAARKVSMNEKISSAVSSLLVEESHACLSSSGHPSECGFSDLVPMLQMLSMSYFWRSLGSTVSFCRETTQRNWSRLWSNWDTRPKSPGGSGEEGTNTEFSFCTVNVGRKLGFASL